MCAAPAHDLSCRLEAALGLRTTGLYPLKGGCVGPVYEAYLEDGRRVALKAGTDNAALDLEAWMLEVLRPHLPVPRVLHASPSLLVMEFVEGTSTFDDAAERHAAELLARLHTVRGERFGLERDTLIGGLPQPNSPSRSWIGFFREHRLLHMAEQARFAGRLPPRTHERIRRLADRLDVLLGEPDAPALIHGDVWTGNVLARAGRITAFLDPAVYFADPEIELAFITLFSTFGPVFFAHYARRRPIRPGFFETRRHIYNLYPLLVHSRLFGGHYPAEVARTLDRLEP